MRPRQSIANHCVFDRRLFCSQRSVFVHGFQVAYTGLLQMFLTQRAVIFVVCNAGAFREGDSGEAADDQLDDDIWKLEYLGVCDWLRWISWRVPDSDVLLVATKCDLVQGMASGVARRMDTACRSWLNSWSSHGMNYVCVEDGVSLTSCVATAGNNHDGGGLEHILERVIYKPHGRGPRGASMVLPYSWHIALVVLRALERGRRVFLYDFTSRLHF